MNFELFIWKSLLEKICCEKKHGKTKIIAENANNAHANDEILLNWLKELE